MAISVDAHEVFELAAKLEKVGIEVLPALRKGIQAVSSDMKDLWKSNAKATAGRHGKHYPNAITYETRTLTASVIGEVGPESGRPQGGMSFEEGSRNQPPHLDGQKAAEVVGPKGVDLIDAAIIATLP